MKRKLFGLLLVIVMILPVFNGCGNGENESPNTEKTESMIGYFEENHIQVTEVLSTDEGFTEFKYKSFSEESAEKEYDGLIQIDETIEGNAKKIVATIGTWTENGVHTDEEIEKMTYYAGRVGFADQYTGIVYVAQDNLNSTTTIQTGNVKYEITVNVEMDETGNYFITVNCPKEYDGATFFVYGTNEELIEENKNCVDRFVSLSDIQYGDYGIHFFVN